MNTYSFFMPGFARLLFRAVFILFITQTLSAQVRVNDLISDGMVIQQGVACKIWGSASPSESITITVGWDTTVVSVIAGTDGKWAVKLPVAKAGGPWIISIKGKNLLKISDVMAGEVWVCSGQSNMSMTVKDFGGWKKWPSEVKKLNSKTSKLLRMFTVADSPAKDPANECYGNWRLADSASGTTMSATALLFGMELCGKLGVPVGLICSSVSGTPAEAWIDKKELETPDLEYYLSHPNFPRWEFSEPGALFNGMIQPLTSYTIKGFIWYQGESNRLDADLYQRLFTRMIQNWRNNWNLGDLPFYFVQIAPYKYAEAYPCAAYLREAQEKSLSLNNTGMVCTVDIGNSGNIHPMDKPEVARRLVLLALSGTYGSNNLIVAGPRYKSISFDSIYARIEFTGNVDGLKLELKKDKPTWFEIAGADKNFVPAEARIEGSSILVWNNSISHPLFVRYAFINAPEASVFNGAGLPAPPFRTDSIPFYNRAVDIGIKPDSSGKVLLTLVCADKEAELRYCTDDATPTMKSTLYSSPFTLEPGFVLMARAFRGDTASFTISSMLTETHKACGKNLTYNKSHSTKYTGGTNALLDGIRGTKDLFDGKWQGYLGGDLDVTINLGETDTISSVSVGYLTSSDAWVISPLKASFSFSNDGINFTTPAMALPERTGKLHDIFTSSINFSIKPTHAKYLRVHVYNTAKLPVWHPSAGGSAWMFIDEIVVK